jgi:hypothetical protein
MRLLIPIDFNQTPHGVSGTLSVRHLVGAVGVRGFEPRTSRTRTKTGFWLPHASQGRF